MQTRKTMMVGASSERTCTSSSSRSSSARTRRRANRELSNRTRWYNRSRLFVSSSLLVVTIFFLFTFNCCIIPTEAGLFDRFRRSSDNASVALVDDGSSNSNSRSNKRYIEPEEDENEEEEDDDEEYHDHWLIEIIAKKIYEVLSSKKYKLVIYLTIRKLPTEDQMTTMLCTMCNVLYGCMILFGFLFLPRGFMLISTLLTLYIGPALVLVMLGIIVAHIVAFAFYPIPCVLLMWIIFFLKSHFFQIIGQRLGLDHDKDGDVDILDLVHYIGTETKIGKLLHIEEVHDVLNEASKNPFKEIHRRLDILVYGKDYVAEKKENNGLQTTTGKKPTTSTTVSSTTTTTTATTSPTKGKDESSVVAKPTTTTTKDDSKQKQK